MLCRSAFIESSGTPSGAFFYMSSLHLLDFPTLERFEEEISGQSYDVIGISGIIVNVGKLQRCASRFVTISRRQRLWWGGRIANKEGLDQLINAGFMVRGGGIRWFQRYLDLF